jgi:cell division protein FtsQ
MKANKLKKAEKGILFFRRWEAALLMCIVIGALFIYGYYRMHHMKPICPVQEVVFADNKRLTDEELREIAGSQTRKSLLTVSCREISRQILRSPWIKSVSVRKEFPGTLSITVQETEPFALLDMHERLFLIDERGRFLEELKGDAVPFLPVIVSDPERERDGFSEALNLVRVMNDKGLIVGKDHIEVTAHNPNELCLEMDEIVVKIGAGEYEEKLERFIHLQEDLRDRNIPVDYIDLRFGDKAIVKPISAKKVEK